MLYGGSQNGTNGYGENMLEIHTCSGLILEKEVRYPFKDKTVLIIGGGLGGLSSAISLAQAGYDVSLYEKNDHIGGKLNRLDQDGFGFDLGPSILTMPQIFERLFSASGKSMKDYVPIEKLDHQWRSFFPDGNVIDGRMDLTVVRFMEPCQTARRIKGSSIRNRVNAMTTYILSEGR
jgi:phytoene dehydrogenase-like protein